MTYTEEFYRLSLRCDLSMTEEKQAMKYISGLKYSIQESDPSDVFSIDEAHNKALKIERIQSRSLPFRCSTPIKKSASGIGVQPSFTMIDQSPTRQSTNVPASARVTTAVTVKRKENLYAKPGVGKCYSCRELEHKSSR